MTGRILFINFEKARIAHTVYKEYHNISINYFWTYSYAMESVDAEDCWLLSTFLI